MNQQIQQLAVAAGQGEAFHIPPEFIDQFAQLIARECASIAQAGGAAAVVTVINEQFGIEL